MVTFYTYLWLRDDGTPYYVGKGSGLRATSFRLNRRHFRRPQQDANIIVQEFESERDAFEAEEFLILYYGRKDLGTGCLRNLTAGGEGFRNARHSEDSRRKMREAAKYRNFGHSKGCKLSTEHRRKISEAMKGNRNVLGYKHSNETIEKMKQGILKYRISLTR